MQSKNDNSRLQVLDKLSLADRCFYKNEIDLVDKLLSIYSITKKDKKQQLRKFEKDVLNYYMRFGYSPETKKKLIEDLKKSSDSITQATFYLTKKGYLVQNERNFAKKSLSKDLLRFSEAFVSGDKVMLVLAFKRK
jgi:hypothetical protein